MSRDDVNERPHGEVTLARHSGAGEDLLVEALEERHVPASRLARQLAERHGIGSKLEQTEVLLETVAGERA